MIRQANYWYHIKNFVIKNEVIINIWNFVNDWFIKALNDKKCEPFKILQQFHFFYKFNILSEWYTIDIFYINDLTRAADSKWLPFTEQRNPPLKSAVINDENQAEWVLNEILNSQYSESDCCFQYKIY